MTLGLGPENRSLKSRVQQQSLKYISAPKGAVGNINVISRLDFQIMNQNKKERRGSFFMNL